MTFVVIIDTSVISFFFVSCEIAGGEFLIFAVVGYACFAFAMSRASCISAGACRVFTFFTSHVSFLSKINY